MGKFNKPKADDEDVMDKLEELEKKIDKMGKALKRLTECLESKPREKFLAQRDGE
jgi:DNA-binding transcriptional regulator GbsR (MarR family)